MARWCVVAGIVLVVAVVLWFVFAWGVDPVGVPGGQQAAIGAGGAGSREASQESGRGGAAAAAREPVAAPLFTLPPLPAGWSFVASLRAHEVLPRWQTEGDFELASSSGFNLRGVLLPDLDAVDAFDGSATVIIGNGPHALDVSLSDEEGNSVPLKDITPATIYAANGDVAVRLSEKELAAAIERLRR